MFWGCPALRAGRAMPQLAVRSALQAFSLRFKSLGSAPSGHCYLSLSQSLRSSAAVAMTKKEKPGPNTKKGPFPHLMTNFGPSC